MAVSFCYGTVGSGKSYDAMCRILEAFRDGHKVVTINMNLKLEACVDALMVVHKMSRYDAQQAVAGHEKISTEPHFRTVRGTERQRIKLFADEAHFWWPKQVYYKMSIEDVLTAAMSRKRQMDIHLISQLNDSINADIKGLAADNWLARPLKVEPFFSGLKLYSRFAQAMGGYGRPAAFFYTRLEDELGRTKGRKDGTIDPDNKKMRFLHPLIAVCYDTLEEISSPVLDRVRDEARFDYYVSILSGKVRPQAVCPECNGKRDVVYSRVFQYVGGNFDVIERAFCEGDFLNLDVLGVFEDECRECGGRGYIYPDNHPDYEIAAQFRDKVDALGRRKRNVQAEK